MSKQKKASQLNFIVSLVLAIGAFLFFAYNRDSEPKSVSEKVETVKTETPTESIPAPVLPSSPVDPAAETVAKVARPAAPPVFQKKDLPPNLPEDMVRALTEPPPELPPDLKAQLNAPPPELPDDLKRQLMAPPPELPPDLKAQLEGPKPELPDDIKKALQTPPRIVTLDEVNNPNAGL